MDKEVMSKFNSQVCTSIEQSKRLLELGLKPETADCQHLAYTTDSKGKPIPKRNQKWIARIGTDEHVPVCGFMSVTFIPAWSLHRLMEIGNIENVGFENIKNAYDTCISMIASHIKFGLLNKEYLKQ